MLTLQQVCAGILLQIIHFQLHVNPLYYILVASKHISVSDTKKPIFNFKLITHHNIMAYNLDRTP